MKRLVVNQYVSQVSRFDAVGNEAFAIHQMLCGMGIESRILCHLADVALQSRLHKWSRAKAEEADITILHYSHGSRYVDEVVCTSEPKALIYHNITPAEYFRGTHPNLELASRMGRLQLRELANRIPVAAAHSNFSAEELRQVGFSKVKVIPYVVFEELYHLQPDPAVLSLCRQEAWTNLICVAQVAPHKRIEDCLFVFDYFKRQVRRQSRLFVIGGWGGAAAYMERLKRLIARLGVEDVIFTGQTTQEALTAYFQTADALLCMSEHEGFCVPLVEAARFGVPIFAYAAAAVPEIMNGSGILFETKEWPVIAESIGLLLSDDRLRAEVVASQRQNINAQSASDVRKTFFSLLTSAGIDLGVC